MTPAGIAAFATLPRADGKPRANNSIRSRIGVARQFLAYCHRNDIPAPDVEHALTRLRKSYPRLFGKQQGTYEARRLTRDELTRLFAACQDGTWRGSRDQIVLRLLALGLRRHEVAQLTWHDLKSDGRIATLGKMHRLREAFPGPTTTDMLTKWRRYYERTIGRASGDAPVLISWACQRQDASPGITDNTVYKIVTLRAAAAGLGHVTPHDLRRTLAKLMNDDGRPLQDIQSALGHAETSGACTQACYIGPLSVAAKIDAGLLID